MATYTYKDRIRDLRKKAGITQDDLTDKIGVSRFSVSNWELGKHPPNADELLFLSNRFNVSVDYPESKKRPAFTGRSCSRPSTLGTKPRVAAFSLCSFPTSLGADRPRLAI